MRKTLVATAVAAIVSAGAFLTTGANAMITSAPAGLKAANENVKPAEQVRYACYRTRRHGVWRRVCSWRPNYGYGYGYGPAYYPAYGYGAPCYWRRERFFDGYGWRIRRVRVCY